MSTTVRKGCDIGPRFRDVAESPNNVIWASMGGSLHVDAVLAG
jgi:hypothetical protein